VPVLTCDLRVVFEGLLCGFAVWWFVGLLFVWFSVFVYFLLGKLLSVVVFCVVFGRCLTL